MECSLTCCLQEDGVGTQLGPQGPLTLSFGEAGSLGHSWARTKAGGSWEPYSLISLPAPPTNQPLWFPLPLQTQNVKLLGGLGGSVGGFTAVTLKSSRWSQSAHRRWRWTFAGMTPHLATLDCVTRERPLSLITSLPKNCKSEPRKHR